ncbi:MAG: hypothetical protein ACR2N6_04970 [Miltoncostaeaceae bacterium]
MIVRPAGALAAVAALVVAVTPALPWFEASLPAGELSSTGFGASGTLWVLPVAAAPALAVALACAARGSSLGAVETRWAGGALLALGALACFWALRETLDPPVQVVILDDGTPRPARVPVTVLPAAVIAPVAAGLMALAGVAIAWPRRAA